MSRALKLSSLGLKFVNGNHGFGNFDDHCNYSYNAGVLMATQNVLQVEKMRGTGSDVVVL
jgi:hypothetical protein